MSWLVIVLDAIKKLSSYAKKGILEDILNGIQYGKEINLA